MTDTTHECPANGCTRRLPFHILACRPHWQRVTRGTQAQVYATWKAGPHGDYMAAREQAIREMNGETTNA